MVGAVYTLTTAMVLLGGSGHPRLFFDEAHIPQLRLQASTTHADLALRLEAYADHVLTHNMQPPSQPPTGDAEEGTWRTWGDRLPPMAMAWLLTEDPKQSSACRDWLIEAMDTMSAWTVWGPTPETDVDLDAAHIMAGFAFACDVLDDALPAVVTYRQRLAMQAEQLQAAILSADPPFWVGSFIQNHNYINYNALLMSGLLLDGDHPDAAAWIDMAESNMASVMEFRAARSDGSDFEGVMYATYGDNFLFQSLDLLSRHRGWSMESHPWMKNHLDFFLHGARPGLDLVAGFSDGLGSWGHGPANLLYFLDRVTGDGQATALATALTTALDESFPWGKPPGATLPTAFLWFDPTLAGGDWEPPANTLHRFDDLDLVTWHAGWDEGQTFLFFKCGVPPGRSAWDQLITGDPLAAELSFGHANPDAGAFAFYPGGRSFIMDSLYERPKRTAVNNTMTFGPPPVIDRGISDDELAMVWDLKYLDQLGRLDEVGQVGEWSVWLGPPDDVVDSGMNAWVAAAAAGQGVVYASGEAGHAYPSIVSVEGGGEEPFGLDRFFRSLVLLPGDVLLVVDRVVTDGVLPSHTYFRSLSSPWFDREFTAQGTTASLPLEDGSTGILKVVQPVGAAFETGRQVTDWDAVHPDLHVEDWTELDYWGIFAKVTNQQQDGETTAIYLLRTDDVAASVLQVDESDPRGIALDVDVDGVQFAIQLAMDPEQGAREGFLGFDGWASVQGGAVVDFCERGPCRCDGDLNANGAVDVADVLAVIAAWGDTGGDADIDGDGVVAIGDLLAVIGLWGPCG